VCEKERRERWTHVEDEVSDVAPAEAEANGGEALDALALELRDDLVDERAGHVLAVLAEPRHEVELAGLVRLERDRVAVEVCGGCVFLGKRVFSIVVRCERVHAQSGM